ncbi:hypothetical protein ACVIQT_002091 [Bradyrhizobium diazoefficiens]
MTVSDASGGHRRMSGIELARLYIDRDWRPIPINHRQKAPSIAGWQNLTVTHENVEDFFSRFDQNVGVILGPRSGGLADVDLDCAEAVRIAPKFLPPTEAVFGRASKPKSHYLYKISSAPDRATEKFVGADNDSIIELRTGGETKAAQTVFPGSVHETGEVIEWARDGEPSHTSYPDLRRAVMKIGAAVVLVRAFPTLGSRHDGVMAIGGCLARACWPVDEIREFAELVATEGGSDQPQRRAADAVAAAEGLGTDHVWGYPKLKEIFGEAPANAFRKIIQIDHPTKGASVDDFYAFLPAHKYLYIPTRALWPPSTIDSIIPPIRIGTDDSGNAASVRASKWLDNHRKVDAMTWAPGESMKIDDRLINNGGWFDHLGGSCFNTYQAPTLILPTVFQAEPWLRQVRMIYPNEAEHILNVLAHRVQKPAEKINHALILGGAQGIGKDTILEPIKLAVGPWNFSEVSPRQVMGRFNGFLKSIVVRVSEARDLGDERYQFYEFMKAYTAAPPLTLRVDEKNIPEYYVPNCCFVIYTTNNKDSFYLTDDDRRHYVAWSKSRKEDFTEGHWVELYRWLRDGGHGHVAAYLAARDISGFDPKAPPPKTAVFWEMVGLNSPPEDAELADALDLVCRSHPELSVCRLDREHSSEPVRPDAVTIAMIAHAVSQDSRQGNFYDWLTDRRNNRAVPHRLERCGYVAVRHETAKDGRWVVNSKRQMIYAKAELNERDRHVAAKALQDALNGGGQQSWRA